MNDNDLSISGPTVTAGDVTKNKVRAIVAYALKSVALMCASGTLMQTFLGVLGFSNDLIYIHSSLLQAANVLTIMLCSRWAESGSILKRSAFVAIPTGLLFLIYIPLALERNASAEVYVFIVLTGIAQQIAIGLSTVCEYKLPYFVYLPDEYGRVLSICGIASSVLSLGIGALISKLTLIYSYLDIMAVSFGISALLMAVVFVTRLLQKSLVGPIDSGEKPVDKKKIPMIDIFRHPAFSHLIVANLARGFAAGVIGVLATVARDLGYDEAFTTFMVSVQSLASLASCAFFAVTAKKIPPRNLILCGSIAVMLSPLLLIGSGTVFLAVYLIVIIGKTLIEYAVPSALLRIVPVEIAGPYHAWRMVLQNAGTLLVTAIAAILPTWLLLALTAALQFLSGISFYLVSKRAAK